MKPKQRFSFPHPSRQLTRFALGPASLGLLLSAGLLLSSAVPNGLSTPLVGTAHAQNSQTANTTSPRRPNFFSKIAIGSRL